MRNISTRLLLVLALASVAAPIQLVPIVAQAQEQSAQKPARKAKPAAKQKAPAAPVTPAAPPFVLPEPPLPVQQAQKLGLTQCSSVVDQMSRGALNNKYDVQSGWSREAPTQHVFQSVAVIERPEVTPANGLAAIIATPTPNGSCDGVAVQVFPLAGDCASAQAYMRSTGSSPIPILNTQIMIDRSGKRVFLLPGVNKTCIAVSVDSTFGGLSASPQPTVASPPVPQAAAPTPVTNPAIPQSNAIIPVPANSAILPTAQPPQ
jgi:hypothetical protein